MRRTALLLLAGIALVGGCDDHEDDRSSLPPPKQRGAAYEERVIRGWLLALGRDDYEQAAYYFAPHALIDQGDPFRLNGVSEARAFNASLPCRADLVGVKDEPGAPPRATFSLGAGAGGVISGRGKVRLTVVNGKFTKWVQFPEEPEPEGRVA